ncbi:UPF0158 family protein [Peribacillus alkalitolerans]|uniref:UPF0158 family protein n=1 Tax=Peribacillus alkalitolerans TaxID=1550385 RepID=UPI0013D25FCD|nr:UPF0158 family protein [Peribacillus alkalitolerans]
MGNPVKLQYIIEELEMEFEESRTFLKIETGEIISVTSEDLIAAEEEKPINHLPDWQQENRNVAIDVFENFENYIELPTKYEVNEYEIIEDFCLSVSDLEKRNLLLNAIQGKGAFRRFKDKIIDFDIEDQWYSYRDERYKEIAIDWCKVNNVNYIE